MPIGCGGCGVVVRGSGGTRSCALPAGGGGLGSASSSFPEPPPHSTRARTVGARCEAAGRSRPGSAPAATCARTVGGRCEAAGAIAARVYRQQHLALSLWAVPHLPGPCAGGACDTHRLSGGRDIPKRFVTAAPRDISTLSPHAHLLVWPTSAVTALRHALVVVVRPWFTMRRLAEPVCGCRSDRGHVGALCGVRCCHAGVVPGAAARPSPRAVVHLTDVTSAGRAALVVVVWRACWKAI